MKVERHKNRIGVEAGWLIEEGYLSKANYDQLVHRNKLLVIRRACYGTPALVDWDTVPSKIKEEIVRSEGDPKRYLVKNELQELITWNASEWREITEYTFGDNRRLPRETQEQYAASAQVLAACLVKEKMLKGKRKQIKHRGDLSVWEKISAMVSAIDTTRHPIDLPKNFRRLQDKARQYAEGGWQVLVHKNFANTNATVLGDEAQKSVLLQLLAHKNNLDYVQVSKHYERFAQAYGWKPISASTAREWYNRHKEEIDAYRRGRRFFMDKHAMQVMREKPQHPLYYWTMDGWRVELYYQREERNKKGQRVTTYQNRLTLEVVLDPCCMYPVGYAIGDSEDGTLIRTAFRNAVKHTEELFGRKYMPHQVQSDNFGGKKATEVYDEFARYYTPAQVGNAKAKIVEPYFKYLNKNYCQMWCSNWSGFGITSRKENQPNTGAAQTDKKSYPTKSELVDLLMQLIETERTIKREAYLEAWGNTEETMRLECSRESYLLYFGERTEKNRIEPRGVTPKIEGIERYYDSFDMSFRQHQQERWVCCYDPDDLSNVLAINEDESLKYVLEEKYRQPMALVDRKEGDFAQLQRVRKYNHDKAKAIVDLTTKRIGTVERLIGRDQGRLEALSKALITDSRGAHKEWLQAASGEWVEAEEEELTVKPTPRKEEEEVPHKPIDREAMYQGIDFEMFR